MDRSIDKSELIMSSTNSNGSYHHDQDHGGGGDDEHQPFVSLPHSSSSTHDQFMNGSSKVAGKYSLAENSVMSSSLENLLSSGQLQWSELVYASWLESKLLWKLSGPAIVIMIFNYSLSAVSQMFAGHLGELELAGASIASVGIQGLAYGIMLGMASAVQTLCGQAYGAGKLSMMGIVCQKAMMVMVLTAFALSFLYYYSYGVLKFIGQTSSISASGQTFARGLIPQLYAFALYCPMQRFLQAQNIVYPIAYLSTGVLLLHLLLSWLAVDVMGYGLLGAALTLSLSWWVLALLSGAYILWSPRCRETWTGWSVKAFSGLWSYFKLTVASAFMLCLEIWYFQGLVLISGLLPDAEVALDSISVCMNYLNWDMQLMLGLSAAASVRVGNELGARRPKTTKFSVMVVTLTCLVISLVLGIMVMILKRQLSLAFTSTKEVIIAITTLTPLLAISVLLNGVQPILSGVAIGCGWQALVAYVNLATYYLIGLPIGLLMGFKYGAGVEGIWWGMILGVSLQTLVLVVLTARTNWENEVEKAVERVKLSSQETRLLQDVDDFVEENHHVYINNMP